MTRLTRVLALAAALAAGGVVLAAPEAAWAQKNKGEHEDIALAIGETRTLPATGVREYSEGVKGIVDVVPTPDGKTFILTGRREGTTTLLLIGAGGQQTVYEVNVAKRNVGVVEREVQELIKDINGPRTRRIGAKVFIDGAVATPAEKARVDQIASLYGEQVQSIVTVGRFEERKLLVRLDFFFVQYERNSTYNVGLGWPATIGGQIPGGQEQVFQNQYTFDLISRTTTSAQASIVNQPMPRLDILQTHGWVKIAKQSSVITANGNEATFQSGGEQNFIISGVGAAQIVPVKFGTNVTVLPRYDSNTRDVEMKLSADVADLTPPLVANGPPGRTTTRLETQVVLKLGQALILSGIKTANQRHNVAGLPGLSEIPVLGLLFGTHSNAKDETEGAVFIVPSVVDTVPKSALELINNAMTTYKEYSGEIEYVEAYPKTPPNAK
ncbi:MAG: pilus assembly protein N-terminal domain-containing protein [Labilithrix sp.]|nr:pilus assembly protein N-terminal domain-containing protein [Labilithrix sp.]MCW5815470.1 pilus assembly protein N-terminal domain-containing protein [Labilithrix sp.]